MAPRAYHLVFRAVSARRALPRLQALPSRLRLSLQFLLRQRRPAACPHRALVGPVKLNRNLVTNAEWLAFMKDGGYSTATLWLMDGFAAVANEGWQAPGHWREVGGEWHIMTLGGLKPVDPAGPVCHVSY